MKNNLKFASKKGVIQPLTITDMREIKGGAKPLPNDKAGPPPPPTK
jgi:hypothetical protein